MKKFNFLILLVGLTLLILGAGEKQVAAYQTDFSLRTDGAVLIDANTGQIIYEENSNEEYPIGDLTSLMVTYVIMHGLQNGTLDENSRFVANTATTQFYADYYGADSAYYDNGSYDYDQLLEAMLVFSAKDAAVSLARAYMYDTTGETNNNSELDFVAIMNDQLAKWGIEHRFYNVTGLDNNFIISTIFEGNSPTNYDVDKTNMFTAKEMAFIAYKLVSDYPQVITISSQLKSETFGNYNDNFALPDETAPYLSTMQIDGLKGLKVGQFTNNNSTDVYYSFVSYVEKTNSDLVSVVFTKAGDNNTVSKDDPGFLDRDDFVRYTKTKELYQYLDDNYSRQKIDSQTLDYLNWKLEVYRGKKDYVEFDMDKALYLFLPKDTEYIGMEIQFADNIDFKDQMIKAPVNENALIGRGFITINDERVQFIIGDNIYNAVDLMAIENVGRPNIFVLIYYWIGDVVENFVNLVDNTII